MRCKTTCKWVSGVFFSQPLNFIWHNRSTRHTCPKLEASTLQAEIEPALEMPFYHSCCSFLCPSPLFPILRLRPIAHAFLSPDTQKTAGLDSLLMEWSLTSRSISTYVCLHWESFWPPGINNCHFPDPTCQMNLPAQCLPLPNGGRN